MSSDGVTQAIKNAADSFSDADFRYGFRFPFARRTLTPHRKQWRFLYLGEKEGVAVGYIFTGNGTDTMVK